MKSRVAAALFAPLAVALLAVPAAAQSKRVSVAVMDFDYGTVNNWWGQYDIGKGMADQVVDELVNEGTFRVIERKKLDTILAEQDFAGSDRADPSAAKLAKVGKVLGVKYIISGSITKFGGEEKNIGGGGFGGRFLGGAGVKKAKTEVTLTARMIDATTGEIVMSSKGEGLSTKGGGLKLGAIGGGVGGGFSMSTDNYRDSAIGEAQEKACADLVAKFVAKASRLEN
jgi:curli biogenesis system outer membrane secretion channel CsgG